MDISTYLAKLIVAIEHRQQDNLNTGATRPEISYWDGYQEALYDLLRSLNTPGAVVNAYLNVVPVDVGGWPQLAQVDAYAATAGVDREQAIRWMVNMAVAHPTRESCHQDGGCDG